MLRSATAAHRRSRSAYARQISDIGVRHEHTMLGAYTWKAYMYMIVLNSLHAGMLSNDDLAELRGKHVTLNDAMVPFMMEASKRHSDAELPIAQQHPGHYGPLHERMNNMQKQLDRIESLLSKKR